MREALQVEPLSRDLEELLAFERQRPAPAGDSQHRVLAGVMTVVSLPPISAPSTGSDVGADAAARTGLVKVATSTGLVAATKAVVLFALGAVSGAGVHAWLRPDVVEAPPPEIRPAIVAPLESTPSPAVLPDRPTAVPPVKPRPAQDRPERQDAQLAAERALLEQARMSMVRGRYGDASAALERHVSEYPEGRLVEEREALSILLQLGVGKTDAARTRFGNFQHRFPSSIFIPSIEQRLDKAKQPSNAAPSKEQPSAK